MLRYAVCGLSNRTLSMFVLPCFATPGNASGDQSRSWTHNLRYAPRHQEIKRLLQAGAIGRVTHVNLAWQVDVRHGASYFFRWNRRRAFSGGLSVRKSCHYLDLVNWWLDERPAEVFGYGALNHYGPRGGLVLPGDALPLTPPQRAGSPETEVTARTDHHGPPYYVQYQPDTELTIHDT